MTVDIIITRRGAPGFSASAVRNPLVKAEPSTQNEAAAKNGFQPSFGAEAKTHFQNPKVPPTGGAHRHAHPNIELPTAPLAAACSFNQAPLRYAAPCQSRSQG